MLRWDLADLAKSEGRDDVEKMMEAVDLVWHRLAWTYAVFVLAVFVGGLGFDIMPYWFVPVFLPFLTAAVQAQRMIWAVKRRTSGGNED